ncbi:hypothetical protein [Halopelagius inordinatus]|uniref:hypothetical protein n=1 Tax=Halopelagius inordinatus TaxID=553467 RepID=UPI000B897FFC|nr:hypothetical protein [Halopelagius inordinatus]
MPPTPPETYSFTRYLRAKESVDDAALHRPTLERFRTELGRLADRSSNPVRIVDVGAGIASMCRRLIEWGVLPDNVTYVVLDADPESVRIGRETTRAWVEESDREAVWESDRRLFLPESATTVRFVADDAFRHLEGQTYDVLVGHAFVDLLDLPDALSALLDGVAAEGVCYFPITFDGRTTFRPPGDEETARAIVEAYHATMNLDEGSARFGRTLLDAAVAADAELLSSGGSDWVVSPPYDDQQAYFLHHVLEFVEESVDGEALDAVGAADTLDEEGVRRWVDARHGAVESGELTYVARNLDVLLSA